MRQQSVHTLDGNSQVIDLTGRRRLERRDALCDDICMPLQDVKIDAEVHARRVWV